MEEKFDKLIRIQDLMDLYLPLLTEKHQELLTLYFVEDLSFTEIAKVLSSSRQAVYDGVKQAIKNLETYENLLNNLSRRQEIMKLIIKLRESIQNDKCLNSISELIDEIERKI